MKELIAIQAELKAPKGQYNSFGKYKYRSAEDILEAVKPLCHKNNCMLTLSDTVELIGERFYIKATAKITNGSESVEVTAYAREEETKKGMDGSQITGTASSYARKYALNGLFCIDDTKDADTDEYKNQQNRKKTTTEDRKKAVENDELIPEGGIDYITNLCIETSTDPVAVCKNYGISSFKEMRVSQFDDACRLLEKKLNRQKG